MTHEKALEAMLTAEPAELRGDAATRLSFHIRDCDRCRAVARTILAEQAELDAEIRTTAPLRSPDELADLVLAHAAERDIQPGEAAADVVPMPSQRGGGSLRPTGWKVAVPALLAAVLAAVLLLPRPHGEWRRPEGGNVVAMAAARRGAIEAPADRSVAVFQTRDPNIKVVWFYETETGETRRRGR